MFNLSALKGVARITAGPTCRYYGNQWINYIYLSGLSPREVIGELSTQLDYSVEHEHIAPTAEELLTAAADQTLQQNQFKCWHLEKITIGHERLRLFFRHRNRHTNKTDVDEAHTICAHLVIDRPFLNMTVHTYSPEGITETIDCNVHMTTDLPNQPIKINVATTKRGATAPSTTITYRF